MPDPSPVEMDDLVASVLCRFNHVSIERIHKLVFLIEYQYFREYERRLTEAEYEPYLSGVYSSDIEDAINETSGVEKDEIKLGGERIETVRRQSDLKYDLPEQVEDIVNEILSEFAEAATKVINSELKRIPIYRDTKIGESVKFDELLVR